MGKGDRRHSIKMMQRKGQAKLKAKARRLATERAARIAAAGAATEKKSRTARKPTPAASSGT